MLGEAAHYFKDAYTAVKTLRVRADFPSLALLSRALSSTNMHAHGHTHTRARENAQLCGFVAAGAHAPAPSSPGTSACWFVRSHPCWYARPIHLPTRLPAPPPIFLVPQKEDSDKPVSDQWLDAFVIVGEDGKPVGTVEDGGWLG